MTGSYEVVITAHSYDNPTGRCALCQGQQSFGSFPGCCDESSIRPSSESCPLVRCDTGMRVCIRRLSLNDCAILNQVAPRFSFNTNNLIFASSFFGFVNPSVVVDTAPWRVSLINIIVIIAVMYNFIIYNYRGWN